MIQNAFAVRPRSIFRAWDRTWKVLKNDTLSMTLSVIELDAATPVRKTVHYRPGQEIHLRWAPFNYRD
jgi:hypothetical protein